MYLCKQACVRLLIEYKTMKRSTLKQTSNRSRTCRVQGSFLGPLFANLDCAGGGNKYGVTGEGTGERAARDAFSFW